jgi:hypothetical protein
MVAVETASKKNTRSACTAYISGKGYCHELGRKWRLKPHLRRSQGRRMPTHIQGKVPWYPVAEAVQVYVRLNNSTSFGHGFNETQQLLAFLKPDHRVGGGFQIADRPTLINDHRGGTLDENHCLLEAISVIDATIKVCQDREW